MKKKRVIVLYGGQSTEHDISRLSVRFVLENIDTTRYEVIPVGINHDGLWLVQNYKKIMSSGDAAVPIYEDAVPTSMFDLSKPKDSSTEPIVVFPVLHGMNGEDGASQGFFELRSFAYVGTGVLGSALSMDKDIAKKLVSLEGIEIAPSSTIRIYEWKKDQQKILEGLNEGLKKPWFVKPVSLGSSVGVYKATNLDDLKKSIDLAFTYDTKVLVESEVRGREIEFAVLGSYSPRISHPGEVVAKDNFYSYDEKYSAATASTIKIPAPMSEEDMARGQKLAAQIVKALNIYGMGRIDFFFTEDGRYIFNEANTLPGLTKISQYPMLWKHSGLEDTELIDILIETALDRWNLQKELVREF